MRNVEKNSGVNSMITFDDLTDEDAKKFKMIVDECILRFSEDPDMHEGFKEIDKMANSMNMTVYEMFLNLYAVDEVTDSINDFMKRHKNDHDI